MEPAAARGRVAMKERRRKVNSWVEGEGIVIAEPTAIEIFNIPSEVTVRFWRRGMYVSSDASTALRSEIQFCFKAIEKWDLSGLDALFGFGDGEPGSAIDFRNGDGTAGARGPFYFALVAGELVGIAIAFEGPCYDDLSALLLDRAQVEEGLGCGEARFFVKFALGGLQGGFAFEVFAFGDGPCSGVFLREEWAARVDEEDLDLVGFASVHQ